MSNKLEQLLKELNEKDYIIQDLNNENKQLIDKLKKNKLNEVLKYTFIILIMCSVFITGRLYQAKKDIKIFEEIKVSYNNLVEEYKDYKAHSWRLSEEKIVIK